MKKLSYFRNRGLTCPHLSPCVISQHHRSLCQCHLSEPRSVSASQLNDIINPSKTTPPLYFCHYFQGTLRTPFLPKAATHQISQHVVLDLMKTSSLTSPVFPGLSMTILFLTICSMFLFAQVEPWVHLYQSLSLWRNGTPSNGFKWMEFNIGNWLSRAWKGQKREREKENAKLSRD